MREYRDDDAVDFAIVGTGAGGGTLACKLAEDGFSVVAFDAGPYWRPLEDFASDETEQNEALLDRRAHRRRRRTRCSSAATTAARRSAAAPCISRWCRCASGPSGSSRARLLGYGADWPLDWREMWRLLRRGRGGAEDRRPGQLSLGPEAAALSLPRARAQRRRPGAGARLRGARHRLGADAARHPVGAARRWRIPASIAASACSAARPTPSRARWSPGSRARSRAGAEIRDLAMVGRIEIDARRPGDRRALPPRGRVAVPAGAQRRRRRLRDRDAAAAAEFRHRPLFPDGLANSSGLVGKYLMVQSNQAVWGTMRRGDPLVQGAAVAGDHRALELHGPGQGFLRRLLLHEPGAAAGRSGPRRRPAARGLWGEALRDEMERYNHQAGLKIVGEMLPQERNRVDAGRRERTSTACPSRA